MNNFLSLAAPLATGMLLGAIFYGGLWWTARKGVSSQQPALWFFGSLLLRMSVALAGFYLVSGGHWQRLVLCLIGFVIARLVIARLVVTRSTGKKPSPPDPGGRPCALLPIR